MSARRGERSVSFSRIMNENGCKDLAYRNRPLRGVSRGMQGERVLLWRRNLDAGSPMSVSV